MAKTATAPVARSDAYLRVSAGSSWTRQSEVATTPDSVIFVDIDDPNANVATLLAAFQALPFRLEECRYLLLRWPQVTAGADHAENAELDDQAQRWADELAGHPRAVGFDPTHVGIVRFRVGEPPRVIWNSVPDPATGQPDMLASPGTEVTAEVLARARRIEFVTLLLRGHGIWRPAKYHYELPSGDHAGVFVRVGDAFRNPRDVRAVASWLASRLRDGVAFVADSATVVPLVTDLAALMIQHGWVAGRAEMLDEYPRTRLDVMRVVRPLLAAQGVIALLTVTSSGSYQGLMVDALARASVDSDTWSLSVLVDKAGGEEDRRFRAEADGQEEQRIDVWSSLDDGPLDPISAADCRLCRDSERAQVVRIDPRSFEALAPPGVQLMMPDVAAAGASLGWWQACYDHQAIGLEAEPRRGAAAVSRPKDGLLGVRFHLDDLLDQDIGGALRERLRQLRDPEMPDNPGRLVDGPNVLDVADCDGVIVSSEEVGAGRSNAAFDVLLDELKLSQAPRVAVPPGGQMPDEVAAWRSVLIISAGSVTGWTMRQHLLRLQDRWKGQRQRRVSGLVVHARPFTQREWTNLVQSFGRHVVALWRTYLPWRSPIAEERQQLTQLGTDADTLGVGERAFFDERRQYTRPRVRDWRQRLQEFSDNPNLPDPRSILWGWGPRGGNTHVRNQSLYGYEVDAVTAYAAVGAAMHAARQAVGRDDPRQAVFEFPAITRSYYDAVILASILRWAEPQECWWGSSPFEARTVMSELLARTADPGDLKILLPELLLAASQGKMPQAAAAEVADQARVLAAQWGQAERAPVGVGLHLLKLAAIQRAGSPGRSRPTAPGIL